MNVGNQLQAWSDGIWRSTKHRVANPDLVDFINRDSASLRDSNGGVSDDDDGRGDCGVESMLKSAP